jgi:hypothetical protein
VHVFAWRRQAQRYVEHTRLVGVLTHPPECKRLNVGVVRLTSPCVPPCGATCVAVIADLGSVRLVHSSSVFVFS